MKFYNTDLRKLELSGAIVVDNNGDIWVAESHEIERMLNRLLTDRGAWRIDSVECAECHESWCEIYLKTEPITICPNCQEELDIR